MDGSIPEQQGGKHGPARLLQGIAEESSSAVRTGPRGRPCGHTNAKARRATVGPFVCLAQRPSLAHALAWFARSPARQLSYAVRRPSAIPSSSTCAACIRRFRARWDAAAWRWWRALAVFHATTHVGDMGGSQDRRSAERSHIRARLGAENSLDGFHRGLGLASVLPRVAGPIALTMRG